MTNSPPPKLYSDRLKAAMKAEIWRRIEAHNAQYPRPQFRKSYPARLKTAEINTLFLILDAWCAQQAAQVNAGGPCTNRVRIDNVSVQGGPEGRDRSNTGRFLGKLAFAGFLVGRKAIGDDPGRYRCQFTQTGGKGFGIVPEKHFRGSNRPYDILLDPALIPQGALPLGTPILSLTGFGKGKKGAPMVESFTVLQEREKAFITEDLNQALSQKGVASPQSVAKMKEGQAPETSPADPDSPKEIEENTDLLTGDLRAEEIEGKCGQTLALQLHQEGRMEASLAVSLVRTYLTKLAPMMGHHGKPRQYVPRSIENGMEAAAQLLLGYAKAGHDLIATFDRLVAAIERTRSRIVHDPQSAFAAPPCKYFDADFRCNIEWWAKTYLLPWEDGQQAFAEKRQPALSLSTTWSAEEAAQKGPYHGLAWSIHHIYSVIIPAISACGKPASKAGRLPYAFWSNGITSLTPAPVR